MALKTNLRTLTVFFADGKYEHKTLKNNLTLDIETFIGRNVSTSYAPVKGEQNYDIYIRELENIFKKYHKNGTVIIPNVTKSYVGGHLSFPTPNELATP